MGLFDKIANGIKRGIGNAVGNAVERKAEEIIAPKINQTADAIAQRATSQSQPSTAPTGGGVLEGALGNLTNAMSSYATQASQNMKICPNCGKPASADKKFCPECGTTLPEQTVAQGAVCPNCGKQNNITEKFCADCGTKLPSAVAQEEKQKADDISEMLKWKQFLSEYPVWDLGGFKYCIEDLMENSFVFSVRYDTPAQAKQAVELYRSKLMENGFRQAGQYPTKEHLYKKIDGICYHVDTEHCFEGDQDCASVYFGQGEPIGGYDYDPNAKKKKKGFFGWFG